MREQSEEALRERIEETRTRMGQTIEEIGERVNPDRVQYELKARAREQMHEFKHNVKQKARDTMRDVEYEVSQTGHSIWDTIRHNPVPAGMVGLGLAWLVANRSGSGRTAHDGYHTYSTGPGTRYRGTAAAGTYMPGYTPGYTGGAYTGAAYTGGAYSGAAAGAYPADAADTRTMHADTGYGEESGGKMDEMKGRAGEAADKVRDKAEHAADNVRDKAGHAADNVREKASDVADRASHTLDEAQHRIGEWTGDARYQARRLEHRVEDAVHENPFAAGAMAVAIGFAAGLMIPETQKEHEMLGRTRDRLLEEAEEKARRAAGKARETVKETAGEAARQAVDKAWSAGSGEEQSKSFSEPRR